MQQFAVKLSSVVITLRNGAAMVTFPRIKQVFLVVLFVAGLHLMFLYKATQTIAGHGNPIIQGYILLIGLFLLSRFLIVIFYTDLHKSVYSAYQYPSISFVIAAKDEEKSIGKTIKCCLASIYPASLEVVVIDDGSKDETRREMYRAQKTNRKLGHRVTVIGFDANRGKREAMAEGVLAASGDVVVFVDSDTFVDESGVRHIVEHFLADERIGAVSGNSLVENAGHNILTKMQSARYAVSFDVFKACESVFGVVTCCPGCFSAYRRAAILPVLEAWRTATFFGSRSTFGDDRSLTNFILQGWRVTYCHSALAHTIAPHRFRTFLKQQLRWKKSWVREGTRAAGFFWRKNLIASASFYINLIIPIAGPLVVSYALVFPILLGILPLPFLFGVVSLGLLYGLYCLIVSKSRYWWYVIPFVLMYIFVLVWQMPYALLKLNDTRWGTR